MARRKGKEVKYRVSEYEAHVLLTTLYPKDTVVLQGIGKSPDLLRYRGTTTELVEGIEVISDGEGKLRKILGGIPEVDSLDYTNAVGEHIFKNTCRGLVYYLEAEGETISTEADMKEVERSASCGLLGGVTLEESRKVYYTGVALGLREAIYKKLSKWHRGKYTKCPNRSVAVMWTYNRKAIPSKDYLISTDLTLLTEILEKLLYEATELWEGDVDGGLHRIYLIAEEMPNELTRLWRAYGYSKNDGLFTQTQVLSPLSPFKFIPARPVKNVRHIKFDILEE